MEALPALHALAAVVALALLAAIALGDVWRLRIANGTVLAATLAVLAWQATRPDGLDPTALALGVILFALAVGLWLLRLFGGGDAKALPLCGLAAGFSGFSLMTVVLALASLALVLAWLALRGLVALAPVPGALARRVRSGRQPFGIAIAASAAVCILAETPQLFALSHRLL